MSGPRVDEPRDADEAVRSLYRRKSRQIGDYGDIWSRAEEDSCCSPGRRLGGLDAAAHDEVLLSTSHACRDQLVSHLLTTDESSCEGCHPSLGSTTARVALREK